MPDQAQQHPFGEFKLASLHVDCSLMESPIGDRKGLIGRLGRFARGIGLVLLLLLMAIPGWILLGQVDAANSADDDLLAVAADRRAGGAAHRTWASLGAEFADLDHSRANKALIAFREGDFSDAAWIRVQADRFSEIRGYVMSGTSTVSPLESDEIDLSEETTDHGPMGLYALVRILSARALLLSRDGRVDDSLEDALFGLRVGHAVANHRDVDLLGLMISGSTQSISLATLEQVVRDHPVDRETARRLTDEISMRRPTRANWQQMWANEYRWVRGVALKAFAPGTNPEAVVDVADDAWASFLVRLVPDDYLIQPNRTLARMAELYRARRDETGRDCLSIFSGSSGEVTAMDTLSLLVRPNPVGELLVLVAHPEYERFELKRCSFEEDFVLAQVVVASTAYMDQEGHLPESLDALVPLYFGAVPRNPYDGRALLYSQSDQSVSVDGRELLAALGPDRAAALDGQSMDRKLERPANTRSDD